jgi:hypothetical protein
MLSIKIDSRYVKDTTIKRICQGDILRDVDVIESYTKVGSTGELKYLTLPYIIVMTQDCDLESDFKNRSDIFKSQDKYLRTILACPAYNASEFREGHHLDDIGLKMEHWNSKMFAQIKEQQHTRFHFLEQDQILQVPDLVVDFKHYYTIPRDTLFGIYKDNYLVTINQLFREYLSQRFSNYLSRIGLPELKERITSA